MNARPLDTPQAIAHVSLCAGYGGLDLGLRRVLPALRTIAYSEIEAFAIANLVAKMEAGLLDCAPLWTDLKTFPWAEFRGRVRILSGGYPCQPFSIAGQRLGHDDPRHLWPFILAGIKLCLPDMCFFENVEGHISLGLREVLGDLEAAGYCATWGLFSAAEVGAPHQRKRVFILAHRIGEGLPECLMLPGVSSSPAGAGQRQDASRNLEVWPSGAGEQQYPWEPPRTVANGNRSRKHQREGDEPDQRGRTEDERNEMGDAQGQRPRALGAEHAGQLGEPAAPVASAEDMADSPDDHGRCGERGEETGTREDGIRGRRSASRDDGLAQPELGLFVDGDSCRMGAPLTVNGDNGIMKHASTNKVSARKILFELWKEARSEAVQWTPGGLCYFLASKILLSGMQLDLLPARLNFLIWSIQEGGEIPCFGLCGMHLYETSRDSSQGSEPLEQFDRELGYALCQLSYEIALERGQKAPAQGELQSLRQASEEAWVLSETPHDMQQLWEEALPARFYTEGCWTEATSIGNRVDELRLCGNGVVPATAERAFRVLSARLNWNV